MAENKEIVEMLENIHLLRRIFIKRATESSPLHFGQVAIMIAIEKNENFTQADIAELLGVTPSSVATSTKRLQKAGLVAKTVDSENLRCKRLTLTEKGREAIERHIGIFDEYDSLVFENFSEDEKNTLLGLLSRISYKMREIEGIGNDINDPIELGCCLRKQMGKLFIENEKGKE